jgi:hypothetical protein
LSSDLASTHPVALWVPLRWLDCPLDQYVLGASAKTLAEAYAELQPSKLTKVILPMTDHPQHAPATSPALRTMVAPTCAAIVDRRRTERSEPAH